MNRNQFLKSLLLLPAGAAAMKLNQFYQTANDLPTSDRMPVVFIGHGSPMNAIEDNNFTKALATLGQRWEKPKAILVVSAHWLTRGSTSVATSPNPETIYDFGGFPQPLYEVKYPAPGSPTFAKQVTENIKSIQVHEDHEMGLDHGAWTILKHIYPAADIPVFQMSIDYSKPPAWHYALAAELKALRQKGVLVLGSGNIVHNLRMATFHDFSQKYDWAVEFDEYVKQRLAAGDHQALVNYQQYGRAAQLSVPTNDHYLPMLYTLGLLDKNESINFTYEEVLGGSISMRCFESA